MLHPIYTHPYTLHLAHPALLLAAPTQHTLHLAQHTQLSVLHPISLSIHPTRCTPSPVHTDTPCTHRHAHPHLARAHTPMHMWPLRAALCRGWPQPWGASSPTGCMGPMGAPPAQHPLAAPVSPASPSAEETHQLLRHLLHLPLCDGRRELCHGSPAVLPHLPGARPPVVHHLSDDLHVSLALGGRALHWHARTRAAPPGLSRAGAYSAACT